MSCASVEHFYSLHPRGQRRRPDWWRRRPSGGGQPSSERTPSGRYLPANASRVHWRRFALLRGKESASRTFKFCSECGRALRYCGSLLCIRGSPPELGCLRRLSKIGRGGRFSPYSCAKPYALCQSNFTRRAERLSRGIASPRGLWRSITTQYSKIPRAP